MLIFILWLVFCFVIAYAADTRGRSGVGWFFISFFFSPLIGILGLLCCSDLNKEKRDKDLLEEMRQLRLMNTEMSCSRCGKIGKGYDNYQGITVCPECREVYERQEIEQKSNELDIVGGAESRKWDVIGGLVFAGIILFFVILGICL